MRRFFVGVERKLPEHLNRIDMTFPAARNWKRRGNMGVVAAIKRFVELDYVVALPLNDSQPYDLIVDDGMGCKRVSCRTTSWRNAHGSYEVGLRTTGTRLNWVKPFDATTADLLFVLTETGDEYLIPTAVITCRRSISLGEKWQQYKL